MATKKVYYHATRAKNMESILADGIIYPGIDGIVYMTESKEDAFRFVRLRVWDEDIYVLELSDLDESKIAETFDHSYAFFQCKSYGYADEITTDHISNCWKYSNK